MGGKLLVIDASLNKRRAAELKKRGRPAIACSELQVANLEDPELLEHLAQRFRPAEFVLVTGDDAMPDEHGDQIARLGLTIATVNQEIPQGWSEDAYESDVIHRWTHVMATQADTTVRRYYADSHRIWTKRRRKRRTASAE